MPIPARDELVRGAEATVGRAFPAPHRARLLRDNGGEVTAADDAWRIFPVWDPTNRRTQSRTANHIVRENEALRADRPPNLPLECVAIAENGTGDLLVLAGAADATLLWDHETGEMHEIDVDWRRGPR